MKERVIAYCIVPGKTYGLDLTPYGPRPWWSPEAIQSVAEREILNLFGVSGDVTWEVETVW